MVEALPTRLPPLRGDAPTLVAGLLKPGAKTVGVTAEGSLGGPEHTLTISEAVPAPDATNYFLVGLVHQWKSADRSAPALVRADRSLAISYEQTRLAREELLTQAHWALSQNQLDAAGKLFEAANKIDPADNEPQIRSEGRRQVERRADHPRTVAAAVERPEAGRQFASPTATSSRMTEAQFAKLAEEQPANPPVVAADPRAADRPRRSGGRPAGPGAPPHGGAGAASDADRRRTSSPRPSARSRPTRTWPTTSSSGSSPPSARTTDLSDRVRATLASRLEGALRWAVTEGTLVRQAQQAELQRNIADQARQSAEAAATNEQEMIRERIKAFGVLMSQARFDEDLQGSACAPAGANQQGPGGAGRGDRPSYQMGLNAANLREFDELRRQQGRPLPAHYASGG